MVDVQRVSNLFVLLYFLGGLSMTLAISALISLILAPAFLVGFISITFQIGLIPARIPGSAAAVLWVEATLLTFSPAILGVFLRLRKRYRPNHGAGGILLTGGVLGPVVIFHLISHVCALVYFIYCGFSPS